MKNIISISTGLVYKFYDDQSSRIQRMRSLNPDGIEICIADSEYVLSFNPTNELVQYLKSLKRITIHAPWIGIQYSNNPLCSKVLKKIEELYQLLWAEFVVVHSNWTDNYDIFRNYNFRVLLENEDYKFRQGITPDQIGRILDINPDIGFNFDFAHALTIWPDTVKEFIDRFGKQIAQVHMSNLTQWLKDYNGPENLDKKSN